MADYELYHHGIKGMKWGIRRTREQLGYAVSKARKRHADKSAVRKEKRNAKKEEKKRLKIERAKAAKPVKDMTMEELQERMYRLNMERQVLSLERQVDSFSAKEVSAGKKFVQSLGSEVLGRSIIDGGKRAMTDWVEKKLKDSLGLTKKEVEDPLKALKDEAAKIKLEGQIAANRMTIRKDKQAEEEYQRSKAESSKPESKSSNTKSDDDDVLKGTVFANMSTSDIDKSMVNKGKRLIDEWEP